LFAQTVTTKDYVVTPERTSKARVTRERERERKKEKLSLEKREEREKCEGVMRSVEVGREPL